MLYLTLLVSLFSITKVMDIMCEGIWKDKIPSHEAKMNLFGGVGIFCACNSSVVTTIRSRSY